MTDNNKFVQPIEEFHARSFQEIIFIENYNKKTTSISKLKSKDSSSEKNSYSHFHNLYEIVYVKSGTGTFLIDNTVFTMKPGDVFFIPPDLIHHPCPDDTDPYDCLVLLFNVDFLHDSLIDINEIFNEQSELGYHYFFNQNLENKTFEILLLKIKEEIDNSKIGFRLIALSYVYQLIVLLLRTQIEAHQKKIISNFCNSKSQIWINGVLEYIDQNYLELKLSLNVLAKQALVSPEHFSRIFKKTTGMSLPSYLNLKKLYHAKNLLLNSNLSLQQISEICGFNDTAYFSKKFKDLWRVTPSEYKKKLS